MGKSIAFGRKGWERAFQSPSLEEDGDFIFSLFLD
jgi:hypothetical protein